MRPDARRRRAVTTFLEFREGANWPPVRAAPRRVRARRDRRLPPRDAARGARSPAAARRSLGFLTEPVPRSLDDKPHPDLAKRARDLEKLDPGNVDRLVSFDPLIVPVAERVFPVWRSLAIPVADRLYADALEPADQPRLLFVGRSTPHREAFLAPVKREFDLLHVAFGAGVDELERLMRRHDTTMNLHNEPYPSFENRVCLHLAAGHLVVSEPLSPTHGLTPGEDYVEIGTPDELVATLRAVAAEPDRFAAIRRSGREKAEAYRASVVFPELAREMVAGA